MRTKIAIIALLTLASCAKEDRRITYTAKCDNCYVWYQSSREHISGTLVQGTWNVDTITVIEGPDTIAVFDSTRVLGEWSMSVSLEHNADPVLKVRNNWNSKFSYGRKVDNGTVTEDSTRAYMGVIEI